MPVHFSWYAVCFECLNPDLKFWQRPFLFMRVKRHEQNMSEKEKRSNIFHRHSRTITLIFWYDR